MTGQHEPLRKPEGKTLENKIKRSRETSTMNSLGLKEYLFLSFSLIFASIIIHTF